MSHSAAGTRYVDVSLLASTSYWFLVYLLFIIRGNNLKSVWCTVESVPVDPRNVH